MSIEHGGEADDREIVSARWFDAPPAQVFAAHVDPARLARWWGPKGFTTTIHAFDPRPGGAWRSVLRAPDGVDYPSESVFVVVEAPSRIVFRHGVSGGYGAPSPPAEPSGAPPRHEKVSGGYGAPSPPAEPSGAPPRHEQAQHPYEMTIELEAHGAGTRCTWRMRHESAEQCARVRPVVAEANEQNFDRLAAELARGP